jgi:glycosyltransferase involved in cell wall biosynthesis
MTGSPRRFVTAAAGSRDFYQIPLALHEAGLLERHVTDFYTPDAAIAVLGRRYPKLGRRHRPDLPSSRVANTPRAIIRQIRNPALPLHTFDQLFAVDADISRRAAGVARTTGADLLLYSDAAAPAFAALPERRRVLFQFHPHPAAVRELLERDFARHPEVAHSFTYELDSQPLARLPPQNLTEWQLATDILCASSFTKQSLVTAGCDPARIRVVPYGVEPRVAHVPFERAGGLACRFLFVGQGVQRKGLHHLLKAWRRAGLGDCSLTVVHSRLDPGIAPLADQPGVTMRARLSRSDLLDLMAASDVFVMPSLVEGFGLVYLEALAAGLHCIGTRNTGLPDLAAPAEAVTLIDAGDEDALVSALTDARRTALAGGFDRAAIRAVASGHDWAAFRAGIRSAIV